VHRRRWCAPRLRGLDGQQWGDEFDEHDHNVLDFESSFSEQPWLPGESALPDRDPA
jgi:hypothetical protein